MVKVIMYGAVVLAILFGLNYFEVVHIPWMDTTGRHTMEVDVKPGESVDRMVGDKDKKHQAAEEALGNAPKKDNQW